MHNLLLSNQSFRGNAKTLMSSLLITIIIRNTGSITFISIVRKLVGNMIMSDESLLK
jgi:hypothetical protein